MVLQAIRYKDNQLHILDQLQLPFVTHYTELKSTEDAWHAIKSMQVRGAPAIAIVAALALAVELHDIRSRGELSSIPQEVSSLVEEKLDYLITSRPTAVNLADAARKLKAAVKKESEKGGATGEGVALVYETAAAKMMVDDVEDNRRIGDFGAEWILKNASLKNGEKGVEVLTHCNTGTLATAGHGTALGVIRSLHAKGVLSHTYCTETRPYNQGARLTAYELVYEKIPATLVTDSMAAALLARRRSDSGIAAIVVGADRVAANGDTANKIGTYGLAILAKYHGVKFLVAAPRTTIDVGTKSGKDIIIEERPKDEVTMIKGPCYTGDEVNTLHIETIKVAATGIDVWNPSFDITPAELIDGIITEVGVVEKDSGDEFHLEDLSKWVDDGSRRFV